MPSADRPSYADKYKLPDHLENYSESRKNAKKSPENERKSYASYGAPAEKKEEKLEDYDSFMRRLNEKKELPKTEEVSDIKNNFCKYCNDAFFTQRAVDVHIMTFHDEDEAKERKAKRKKVVLLRTMCTICF